MSIVDYILIALIAGALFLAVRSKKKHPGCGCGCENCGKSCNSKKN